MNDKNIQFLSKTADILIKELDSTKLVSELNGLLRSFTCLNNLDIYVFDPNTSTLRNYAQDWCVIDEVMESARRESIYRAYEEIHGNDFVINNKAFKLPQTLGDITFKLESLYIPIVKNGMVFGIIELVFDENASVDIEFLFLMKILGVEIS